MKKFLYRTHIDYIIPIWVCSIMLCSGIVMNWYQWQENLLYDLGGIILVLLGTIFLVRYIKSMGVYIDNESVLFKTWFIKKSICVEEIAAIKIEKAIQGSNLGKSFFLKDKQGRPLFSMIAVSSYDADMLRQSPDQDQKGDTDFCQKFKKSVLFYSVYDQSVIDYLLTLNPNIIVC